MLTTASFPGPPPTYPYGSTAQQAQVRAGYRIGIIGDSAGGNLAAAVTLRARDESGPTIAYQVPSTIDGDRIDS